MAAVAFNVIGILFGVISMAPMLESMLPSRADKQTTVRIGVGTSISKSGTTSGNTPGIRIFDVMGRDIGEARGSKSTIADGGFKDIVVTASSEQQGRQAQYLSVSKGGDDALCIAYISVTWPDGQKKAWYGDVGYTCGGSWYNSQTIIGESDNYQPKCVWIDGDASNGITTQGMGIHLTDFTATKERAKAYADDRDTMCKSKPRFHLYDKLTSGDFLPYFDPPLEYDANLVDKDRSKVMVDGKATGKLPPKNKRSPAEKRSILSKRQTFPGQLVTSTKPAHSAKELCQSETSLGPDFVSHHESLFCDMSEKQLWPLCDQKKQTSCFDMDSKMMIANNHTVVGYATNDTAILNDKLRRDVATGRVIPDKTYTDVKAW